MDEPDSSCGRVYRRPSHDGLAAVFAALANEERLAILRVLRDVRAGGGASISVVADTVGLSRFSASRHLRVLAQVGLVTVERDAQSLIHRLHPRGLDGVEDWLYAHLLDPADLQPVDDVDA